MDVEAARTADRRVLVDLVSAVAENARSLLADAELLLDASRWARAYSLAVFAAEEWAKAYAVLTLSFMSPQMRSRIPAKLLRDFLEGHEAKGMGAVLMGVVNAARPGVADRIATMPQLADVLLAAARRAGDVNAAKQRGLYADMLPDGTLSLPSSVSETEATEAVTRAREVEASAALLHDQNALSNFADPPTEALEIADAVFGLWLDTEVNDAEAAAAFVADIAARLAPLTGPKPDLG